MVLILLLIILISYNSMSQDTQRQDIRPQAVAGSFYPQDATELRGMLDSFFSTCQEDKSLNEHSVKHIMGIVSPHAGYIFSGETAAKAYYQVRDKKFDLAIVISPSHREYFEGASVFDGDAYQTPLGLVQVDKSFAQLIPDGKNIVLSKKGHELTRDGGEHALEVQLPFLQYVQPDLPVVPIVMGSQDFLSTHRLVRRLAEVISESGKRVLLVASTDLSHFHNEEEALAMDSALVRAFDSYDYFKMQLNCAMESWEACGAGPMAVMMQVCELLGANKSKSLYQCTSADCKYTKIDNKSVVGYFSGIVGNDGTDRQELLPTFNEKDRANILNLARKSVEANIAKVNHTIDANSLGDVFTEEFPAFVTINKKNAAGQFELRACMGHIIGSQNLRDEIISTAQMASTQDSRFGAVTPGELGELKYDVTVLSRFKKIVDVNEIKIGKHGLYIRKGRNSGLFLPQVPVEQGWDLIEYLVNICFKAGLPRTAITEYDCEIYIFEAVVIEE